MALAEVHVRLDRWLAGEYESVLFEDQNQAVGDALFRQTDPDLKGPDGIYVRQFFISREHRWAGFGRRAFDLLRLEVFPSGMRIVLEAVSTNRDGQAFWRSMGFREHSVLYELGPSHAANPVRCCS
jgi:GNAT superfamily N-acetyltransferase